MATAPQIISMADDDDDTLVVTFTSHGRSGSNRSSTRSGPGSNPGSGTQQLPMRKTNNIADVTNKLRTGPNGVGLNSAKPKTEFFPIMSSHSDKENDSKADTGSTDPQEAPPTRTTVRNLIDFDAVREETIKVHSKATTPASRPLELVIRDLEEQNEGLRFELEMKEQEQQIQIDILKAEHEAQIQELQKQQHPLRVAADTMLSTTSSKGIAPVSSSDEESDSHEPALREASRMRAFLDKVEKEMQKEGAPPTQSVLDVASLMEEPCHEMKFFLDDLQKKCHTLVMRLEEAETATFNMQNEKAGLEETIIRNQVEIENLTDKSNALQETTQNSMNTVVTLQRTNDDLKAENDMLVEILKQNGLQEPHRTTGSHGSSCKRATTTDLVSDDKASSFRKSVEAAFSGFAGVATGGATSSTNPGTAKSSIGSRPANPNDTRFDATTGKMVIGGASTSRNLVQVYEDGRNGSKPRMTPESRLNLKGSPVEGLTPLNKIDAVPRSAPASQDKILVHAARQEAGRIAGHESINPQTFQEDDLQAPGGQFMPTFYDTVRKMQSTTSSGSGGLPIGNSNVNSNVTPTSSGSSRLPTGNSNVTPTRVPGSVRLSPQDANYFVSGPVDQEQKKKPPPPPGDGPSRTTASLNMADTRLMQRGFSPARVSSPSAGTQCNNGSAQAKYSINHGRANQAGRPSSIPKAPSDAPLDPGASAVTNMFTGIAKLFRG